MVVVVVVVGSSHLPYFCLNLNPVNVKFVSQMGVLLTPTHPPTLLFPLKMHGSTPGYRCNGLLFSKTFTVHSFSFPKSVRVDLICWKEQGVSIKVRLRWLGAVLRYPCKSIFFVLYFKNPNDYYTSLDSQRRMLYNNLIHVNVGNKIEVYMIREFKNCDF